MVSDCEGQRSLRRVTVSGTKGAMLRDRARERLALNTIIY